MHRLKRWKSEFGGELRFDRATRLLYATDASIYRCEPQAVFFPKNEDDLVRIVNLAAAENVPILPRGGGTSLSGQAVTSGVMIDISAFNAIRIDPTARTAKLGPGAVIDAIDAAGRMHGLRYGPAPASSNRATIGGMIANNGTGARSIKFGMTSDHVLALRVLLSDGSIREFRRGDLDRRDPLDAAALRVIEPVVGSPRWPMIWRNASGLDLRGVAKRNSLLPLFAGSEGSLGIILDAEITLVPSARTTQLALFYYDSLVAAMEHVPALLETAPSAVELMDRKLIELAGWNPRFRMKVLSEIPEALLVVEYEDKNGAEEALGLGARRVLDGAAEQAEIWRTRKEGLGILMSTRGRRRPVPFIEDCAVPIGALPEYVRRLDGILRAHGTDGAYYAHASAGCLHTRPLLDLTDANDRAQMESIMEEMVELVAELGGTLSGEHGDGRSKRPYLDRIFGPEIVAAFEKVQEVFDPRGIFRPGLEGELRHDLPVTRRIRESFSFPGGFAAELDRCNGEAACRKMTGVMCPSFQATGNEFLTTRGRANLLRAWMSGEPVEEALDETLSQCLACKGCAIDCPSQVDMATFKAQYRALRPPAIADHFFAHFGELVRIARRTGILFPSLVKKIVGIDRRCELPKVAERRFSEACAHGVDLEKADAILYVDTHTEYLEPSVGIAAMKIFAKLGLRVAPYRAGCCGRPAFSRGRLEKARGDFEKIAPPGAAPIIVLEPSCLSMMRSDAPLLEKGFTGIADRVVSFEAFVLRHADRLRVAEPGTPVVYHGHCHQKALDETSGAIALFEKFAPTRLLVSGCCGMAGSFGYEEKNYDLSEAIAHQHFLPGIRAARDVGEMIALSGRSCREMASRHGIVAFHPAEVLAKLMA